MKIEKPQFCFIICFDTTNHNQVIFFSYCQYLKMSWLEHFLKLNKRGVWNKNVLGGKFSERRRLLDT